MGNDPEKKPSPQWCPCWRREGPPVKRGKTAQGGSKRAQHGKKGVNAEGRGQRAESQKPKVKAKGERQSRCGQAA